jgi:light-regulated signal transduction histidine kinase (bacteriophytochrome)
MDEKDLEKSEEVFKRHIGILSEDFQHKLDIVAEGNQMLSEKLDRVESRLEQRIDGVEQRIGRVEQRIGRVEQRIGRVEQRIDEVNAGLSKKIDGVESNLSKKIDAVAAALAAHRADTEIHRARYQIREDTDS